MAHLMPRRGTFTRFARWTSQASGQPTTFALAFGTIVVWGLTGPMFHFSDTWQLVINTSTTIVTFLMVFLIQNTQNRDSHAVQLKLDELIRATRDAHAAVMDLEALTDDELCDIKKCYTALALHGREQLRSGEEDTGIPIVSDLPFGRKHLPKDSATK